MRTSSTRRILASCGLVSVLALAAVGCSSDDSSDTGDATSSPETTEVTTTTTSATETSDAAAAADEQTTQEVTEAYVVFFTGTTPPAERAALVENGDTFLPLLEGMTADPQATATAATVEGVTSTGDDAAAVQWTLMMNGAPVLPDQSGEAIREDGQWKVSAVTFCTLLAIQGDGSPVPGC